MTTATALLSSHAHPRPTIRRLELSDLRAALADGIDDFRAMPTHVLFLVMIYPITGLLIGAATLNSALIPLLFPLASGFALLGPFTALGLYEMSRRREHGLNPSWMNAYGALRTPSAGAILSVGLLLAAIFLAWLVTAMGLHWALFGDEAHGSVAGFAQEVLTTERGWTMILVGNLAGLAFSLLALAVSVVSLPMLADRTVDAATAVRTSIAVVQKNPGTMLAWGFVVAGLLVVGMLPLFIGLAVVLPILGHATWHLYRRAVP